LKIAIRRFQAGLPGCWAAGPPGSKDKFHLFCPVLTVQNDDLSNAAVFRGFLTPKTLFLAKTDNFGVFKQPLGYIAFILLKDYNL